MYLCVNPASTERFTSLLNGFRLFDNDVCNCLDHAEMQLHGGLQLTLNLKTCSERCHCIDQGERCHLIEMC